MTRLHFNAITGQFTKGTPSATKDPALARERGRNVAAVNKARKLAEAHGIDLEKDPQGGWWVTCGKFAEEVDPLDGSHFCGSGLEALEAVETYVAELAKLPA